MQNQREENNATKNAYIHFQNKIFELVVGFFSGILKERRHKLGSFLVYTWFGVGLRIKNEGKCDDNVPATKPWQSQTHCTHQPNRTVPEGLTDPQLRSVLAHFFTWNTVSKLCTKVSKLLRGFASVESKLNLPPKTCIPSRAKMTIKRKRSSNREAMDWIELRSEATRLERDRQYLKHGTETRHQRTLRAVQSHPPAPLYSVSHCGRKAGSGGEARRQRLQTSGLNVPILRLKGRTKLKGMSASKLFRVSDVYSPVACLAQMYTLIAGTT